MWLLANFCDVLYELRIYASSNIIKRLDLDVDRLQNELFKFYDDDLYEDSRLDLLVLFFSKVLLD